MVYDLMYGEGVYGRVMVVVVCDGGVWCMVCECDVYVVSFLFWNVL